MEALSFHFEVHVLESKQNKMNGEFLLGLDPYNFNTEEEFVRFYCPELLEEEKSKTPKAKAKEVFDNNTTKG